MWGCNSEFSWIFEGMSCITPFMLNSIKYHDEAAPLRCPPCCISLNANHCVTRHVTDDIPLVSHCQFIDRTLLLCIISLTMTTASPFARSSAFEDALLSARGQTVRCES